MDIKAARDYYYQREAFRWEERELMRRQWLKRVRKFVGCYAPRYPAIRRVYLFGSLLQPGRFGANSDIDMVVDSDSLESESAFWRILERNLQRNVDIRPMTEPIIEILAHGGEQVYEREDIGSLE